MQFPLLPLLTPCPPARLTRRPQDILTDGSSQLVPLLLTHDLVDELHSALYPLTLGGGKRILPQGLNRGFRLISATPYPTGVVVLKYARQES